MLVGGSLFGRGQQESFDDFVKQQQADFDRYLDEQDAAFAEFLEKDWEQFRAFVAMELDFGPKPDEPPVVEPEPPEPTAPPRAKPEHARPAPAPEPEPPAEELTEPEPEPDREPAREPVAEPEPELTPAPADEPTDERPAPEPKPEPAPAPAPPSSPPVSVTTEFPVSDTHVAVRAPFYGRSIVFSVDPELTTACRSQDDVPDWWRAAAAAEYDVLVDQLAESSEQQRLNDWGRLQLIGAVATAVHAGDTASANAFAWFLAVKSGLDVRLGFHDDAVLLLVAAEQTMYGVPYLTFASQQYFMVRIEGGEVPERVTTYPDQPELAVRPLDLTVTEPPALARLVRKRELVADLSDDRTIQIPLEYNANMMEFYDSYPQTALQLRFQPPVHDLLNRSLAAGLEPYLQKKDPVEDVYTLMKIIHSLEYKTDHDQFGVEKYMFADEVIYYSFSDCEDRCAIFSYLVRRFLDLNTLILIYPGHVATAVELPGPRAGDRVDYQGRTFTVCDPTYIGSAPGMSIPKFKDTPAKSKFLLGNSF